MARLWRIAPVSRQSHRYRLPTCPNPPGWEVLNESQRRLVLPEQDPEEVHGDQRRALPDVLATPGDDGVPDELLAAGELGAEADVADRLLLRAAVRAGDAGEADRHVGAEAGQRAIRHRLGDLG